MNVGVLMICLMFAFILLGMPVAFGIGAAGLFALLSADMQLVIIPQKLFTGLNSFSLLAIPMFVLGGNIMTAGGINRKIMSWADSIVGWMAGSKALITVLASAIFAAISGSGTATVSAIGSMTIPIMKEDGYEPEFSAAVASSSAILGPLIPPSIFLIVYGTATQSSAATLFKGAVFPGLTLAFLFFVYVYWYAKRHKFPVGEKPKFKRIVKETKESIWALLMPVIILGGILGGIFTATEAAAVLCVYAVIVGIFIYKDISFKDLYSIILGSAISSAALMYVVGCSKISSYVLAASKVTDVIANAILSVSDNRIIILLVINLLLLFVGMLMEANVAILIFTPILLPIAASVGMSTLTLGVMMTINLCLGLLTPPVGLCLIMGNDIAKANFGRTLKRALPFFIISLFVIALVTYWPAFTEFLPSILD